MCTDCPNDRANRLASQPTVNISVSLIVVLIKRAPQSVSRAYLQRQLNTICAISESKQTLLQRLVELSLQHLRMQNVTQNTNQNPCRNNIIDWAILLQCMYKKRSILVGHFAPPTMECRLSVLRPTTTAYMRSETRYRRRHRRRHHTTL